jgi:ferritin-like metal-binding protein YciE
MTHQDRPPLRDDCAADVSPQPIPPMSHTTHDALLSFLSDMYAVELQALAQLKSAPSVAHEATLAESFTTHLRETERQAEAVRQRLEALGGTPSTIKDVIMKLGGRGFVLFARLQLETPGRLVAHAYAYEAMEWAGYAVLQQLADVAGDEITMNLARDIQAEERGMMQRLEAGFDAAESASHDQLSRDQIAHHLVKHLAEAHALECQSIKLQEKAPDLVKDPDLAAIFQGHLEESRLQLRRLEDRLKQLQARPSFLQDMAMKLGALEWGLFFRLQSDTPAKLCAFAFAVEHLEIAAYELLRRNATRAHDPVTIELCDSILAEERAMAVRLARQFPQAVRATLEATVASE